MNIWRIWKNWPPDSGESIHLILVYYGHFKPEYNGQFKQNLQFGELDVSKSKIDVADF